jgi:superfamily II RNA helicase
LHGGKCSAQSFGAIDIALSLLRYSLLHFRVNLPARLVIVKGTEFFDGKTSRYVDYPLTDVLQMIGRAGRPGFDTVGEAVVMAVSDKKDFYKKVSGLAIVDSRITA